MCSSLDGGIISSSCRMNFEIVSIAIKDRAYWAEGISLVASRIAWVTEFLVLDSMSSGLDVSFGLVPVSLSVASKGASPMYFGLGWEGVEGTDSTSFIYWGGSLETGLVLPGTDCTLGTGSVLVGYCAWVQQFYWLPGECDIQWRDANPWNGLGDWWCNHWGGNESWV